MVLFLALLAGAADFAAEMLVLRSGRFGLGASPQSTALLLALALSGMGVGAALAARVGGARAFVYLRICAGFAGAAAVCAPIWLAGNGGWLASAGAPAAAMAAAFLFAIPVGASIPYLYPWTGGRAARAGLLISAGALGSVPGAWFGGVFGPIRLGTYICALAILGVNLLLAALAMYFAASLRARPSAEKPRVAESFITIPHPTRPKAAVWFAFASGALTLALESLFGRLAPFFLGDGSDSIAFVLGAALIGISAGSAASGFLLQQLRVRTFAALLVGCAALSGPLLLCVLEMLGRLPWIANPLSREEYNLGRILILGMLVAPPLALAGALSPLAFALAEGESRVRIARLNLAYAAGALAPALIVPFLLSMGVSTTAICGAAGICVFPAAISFFGLRTFSLIIPIASGALLGASPITTRVPPFRGRPWLEVLEAKEGPMGLAAAVLDRRRHEKTLFTNQFRAAATGDDYRYTRSLAHLPMLLAGAESKSAAIIAVGTGSTAAAAARHASLGRIDLIEISGEVFDLLHWFSPASDGLFVNPAGGWRPAENIIHSDHVTNIDPRLHIIMDDGRRFAAREGDLYDLIVLEPLLPDTPAAYPFYTKEFYQLATRRIRPGGVLTQWIPILATEPRAFRALVATFTQAFPNRALFLVGKSAILLGSDQPLRWNEARARAALLDPALAVDLQRTGCASAGDVAAQCVLGTQGMGAFQTELNLSDEKASIERHGFFTGAARIRYELENIDTLIRAREGAPHELLPSMEALPAGEQEARRAAGNAYLRARRSIAEASGQQPGPGLESDLAALTASTAHPFAAMDGESFLAQRMFSIGGGHLANNEISRALAELEHAARHLRDPVSILAFAVALHRSQSAENAAVETAVALSLDPDVARELPARMPLEARGRLEQDLNI